MRHPVSIAIAMLLALALGVSPAAAGTFPAENPAAAEALALRVRAAHFLSWATFGPRKKEIEALAQRMESIGETPALKEWIRAQFEIPPTRHEPLALQMIAADGFTPLSLGIGHTRYREHAWWDSVINAPDQLRQRMAWALAQIFVVNQNGAGFNSQINDASGNPQYLGIVNYYDMLVQNAFGNYRQAIEDVTYHPVMGVFLTFVKNLLPIPQFGIEPDENYAREVKQLKSVGLYELRMNGERKTTAEGEFIETYDNEDIKAMARVFTGLTFDDPANVFEDPFRTFFRARPNYHDPMVMIEAAHDKDEKILLTGDMLPAGQPGDADIGGALDVLANHPNVGPFISRLIVQRLVKSNPSKRYLRDLARAFNDNGAGVRGDFKHLLEVMLTHPEAFKAQSYRIHKRKSHLLVRSRGTEHTRLQEPVVRYAQFMRAFDATPYPNTLPEEPNGWEVRCNDRFMVRGLQSTLNQQVYAAPSVFNFYAPDHQPAGDLLSYTPSRRIPNGFVAAPELQIFTSVAANTIANRFRNMVRNGWDAFGLLNNDNGRFLCLVTFDFSYETELAAEPDALMTHLDLLLCHGSMQDSTKKIIADALKNPTTTKPAPGGPSSRRCCRRTAPSSNRGNSKRTASDHQGEIMKRRTSDPTAGLSRREFLRMSAGGCAAMSSVPLLSTLLNLELTRSAAAATGNLGGYRALVCIFLFGGYDAFNVLVPYEPDEYQDYESIRGAAGAPGGLAIARETLLSISDPLSGRQFGIHPGMPEVQQLYNEGKLAFVSNVGSLVEPTDLAAYQAGQNLPLGLFSHNDMQHAWQTCVPQSRQQITGWGGRMADALTDTANTNPAISMNIALNSLNAFQSGDTVVPYVVTQGGAQVLQGYNGGSAFDRIMTRATDGILEQTYSDLLSQTHARSRRSAIDAAIEFNEAVEGIGLGTVFPPTFLGSQLNMIARIIAARDLLGHARQIFFAFWGGWDHHANLLPLQAFMLPQVSGALESFSDAMVELGVQNDVTAFTASDFGRTMATNGNGTDHAWGNNHIVAGGGVEGGKVYGEYPASLALGNPLDTGRGRLIPTTSVTEYSAELAQWFGIPNDSTLETILPNIRNFYAAGAAGPPLGFMAQNVA